MQNPCSTSREGDDDTQLIPLLACGKDKSEEQGEGQRWGTAFLVRLFLMDIMARETHPLQETCTLRKASDTYTHRNGGARAHLVKTHCPRVISKSTQNKKRSKEQRSEETPSCARTCEERLSRQHGALKQT